MIAQKNTKKQKQNKTTFERGPGQWGSRRPQT